MHVLPHASRDHAHWIELATSRELSLLIDLEDSEGREIVVFGSELAHTLRELVVSGVAIAIRSRSARVELEGLIAYVPGALWFAEQGRWRWHERAWHESPQYEAQLATLARRLANVIAADDLVIGAESLTVRCVSVADDRRSLLDEAARVCDAWVAENSAFVRLASAGVIEVRSTHPAERELVRHLRGRSGGRLLALTVDEAVFSVLGPSDVGVALGSAGYSLRAHAAVVGSQAVRELAAWVLDVRRGRVVGAPPVTPVVAFRPAGARPFVAVSSRSPHDPAGQRDARDLVIALAPVLHDRGGIWVGWSGLSREGPSRILLDVLAEPPRAFFDLPAARRDDLLAGFCGRSLWSLFHGFPRDLAWRDDQWNAYVQLNDVYAGHVAELASTTATIWAHDYHLLLVAAALRTRGHRGSIALSMHVPFPRRDLFDQIPWRDQVLAGMLAFDLIGFRSDACRDNFLEVAARIAAVESGNARHDGHTTAVVVSPATTSPAWAPSFLRRLEKEGVDEAITPPRRD